MGKGAILDLLPIQGKLLCVSYLNPLIGYKIILFKNRDLIRFTLEIL
jgi:hypothetical protein